MRDVRVGWTLLGLFVVQLALLVSLLLPWRVVDCDDGCTDGRAGGVVAHLPLDARVVLAVVLSTLCVVAIAASRKYPRLRRVAALLGLAAALIVASLLAFMPTYQNDAPILDRLYGWGFALAWTGLSALLAVVVLALSSPVQSGSRAKAAARRDRAAPSSAP